MRVALRVLASLAVASAQGEQCFETCRHSADSDCDDGGPGAEYALCHFSTDCTDCGVRIAGEVRTGRTGWCIPRGSFVNLDFNEARLYRSNIGGQGGRCWIADQCDEQLVDTDATDIGLLAGANTVHEMYIRGIATNSIDPLYATGGSIGGGEQVDLVVTNTTEYKSWDTSWNWVKQEGALEALLSGETLGRGGGFVGTNLAGARQVDQPGVTSGWSETFTACEFLYQFVTGDPSNRRPITIPRTYISVYVSEPRAPALAHGPWPSVLGLWPLAHDPWPMILGPWSLARGSGRPCRCALCAARATRHIRQDISSHKALRGAFILPRPLCRVVVVHHALWEFHPRPKVKSFKSTPTPPLVVPCRRTSMRAWAASTNPTFRSGRRCRSTLRRRTCRQRARRSSKSTSHLRPPGMRSRALTARRPSFTTRIQGRRRLSTRSGRQVNSSQQLSSFPLLNSTRLDLT